jgi:hypothetical protein
MPVGRQGMKLNLFIASEHVDKFMLHFIPLKIKKRQDIEGGHELNLIKTFLTFRNCV